MYLLAAALLLLAIDSFHCALFVAHVNMKGVTGEVQFNSTSKMVTVDVSGAGSCMEMNISLSEFPVMFGHFSEPCLETNIGSTIFNFPANVTSGAENRIPQLFDQIFNLDDLSLSLQTCDGIKVCTTVSQGLTVITKQARFTESVLGNIYMRLNQGNASLRVLADLTTISETNISETNFTLSGTNSVAGNCEALLTSLNSSALTSLGVVKVGKHQPQKSRLDLSNLNEIYKFLLINNGSTSVCAQVFDVPGKQVEAVLNMEGIKGHFSFKQASPFDVTEISMNLTNLQSRVGPYHVHQFPIPYIRSNMCSNDNVGDHWNPYGINKSDPTSPKAPGSTHDKYEIGDLSAKHMSLEEKNDVEATFTDFNLPLFGNNSIVGRSVVIHKPDGSRFVCAPISYPGEVITGRAIFQGVVVGQIMFTQLVNNPLSDVSVFLDLSYGNPTASPTEDHNWHVHLYPISSERDGDAGRCASTGGHWNPFNINTNRNIYPQHCTPSCPLCCEVGDFAGKDRKINLNGMVGGVDAKHFFTDVTSWLPMSGIIGRSVVIHEANKGDPRIACANVTMVRATTASVSNWFGPGSNGGQIKFSQSVPNAPTTIKVDLDNLNSLAGGYHVHILPLKAGNSDSCSNANILGHFNPFMWNISTSPPAGKGTFDQYEVGDISGKFGLLTGKNDIKEVFEDSRMPLTGVHSIVGRSLVIHFINESRMRCANISAEINTDGQWTNAKAVFTDRVTGTVWLRQQMFPDGSQSDLSVVIDLQSASENMTPVSLSVTSDNINASGRQCSNPGSTFNPFNMDTTNSRCSLENPLSCVVGDISTRHGDVSLTVRQLYTDSIIQLSGDNTVVYRSLVLKNGARIISCAQIVPESPSAQQVFVRVQNFNRYDFRNRVAEILEVDISRVTILPGSPQTVANGKCQQVSFMVSGDVTREKMNSVKNHAKMEQFKESNTCTGNAGLMLVPRTILLNLMFAVACLVPTINSL